MQLGSGVDWVCQHTDLRRWRKRGDSMGFWASSCHHPEVWKCLSPIQEKERGRGRGGWTNRKWKLTHLGQPSSRDEPEAQEMLGLERLGWNLPCKNHCTWRKKNKIAGERIWKQTRGSRTKAEKHLYLRDEKGARNSRFDPGRKREAGCVALESRREAFAVGSTDFIAGAVLN